MKKSLHFILGTLGFGLAHLFFPVSFVHRAAADDSDRLEIQAAGTNAIVRWRVSSNSWQLYRANHLTPPIQWQPLSEPVVVQDGFHQVRVDASRGAGFFELQRMANAGPGTLQLAAGSDHFFLEWAAVAGATAYNVYLGTNSPVGPGNCVRALTGVTNTAALVEGLVAGGSYCFTVTAVLPGGESRTAPEVCGVFGPRGSVLGQFCVEVNEGAAGTVVHFVPGVTAWLSNSVIHQVTATQVAQSDGYIRFHDVPIGEWVLCWQAAGFSSGCSAPFAVEESMARVPTQKLTPVGGQPPVRVRVQFADGSSPRLVDAFYELDLRPVVEQLNEAGVRVAVGDVNGDGTALLVPAVQCCPRLTVQVEGAQATGSFPPPQTGPLTLTLPNRPPVVDAVRAAFNGVAVLRAPPGATVQLSVDASDPDGNPLSYRWFAADTNSLPQPRNAANPTWTLPTNVATLIAYVRVGDGRGGYAFGQVEIKTAPTVTVSGRVVAPDPANPTERLPIAGAAVRAAGLTTNTGTDGRFSLDLPAFNPSGGVVPEFPLDIRAPGYLPLQAEFPDEVADVEFLLGRLNVQSLAYDGSPLVLRDAQGNEVMIPRSGLVDSAGNAPTVVVASFTPLDPQAEEVPITLAARAAGGAGGPDRFAHRINLVHLDLRDGNGQPLHLAAGASLSIGLVTSTNGLAAMGATPAPLTRAVYDFASRRFGPGSPVNPTPVGGLTVYAGPVLPPALTNLVIGDFADKELIPIFLKADRTINHPYQVRVDNKALPFTILSANPLAGLIAVGRGCPTRLRVFHLSQGPGEHYGYFSPVGGLISPLNKTVIIDKTVTATSNFLVVSLSLSNHIPTLNPNKVKSPSHFLSHGLLGQPDYTNNVKDFGNAYYHAIQAPATFKQWKIRATFEAANGGGIVAPPLDEAGAEYYNAVDLGFARKMRMRKINAQDGKTNVFYYVTNYRTIEDAIAGNNPLATVCMDYAALPPVGQRFTRFYVYDGATELLLPTADLDGGGSGGGQRAVPNLCVVCHGGQPATFNSMTKLITPLDGDLRSKFLPFDLESYNFSQARGVQAAQLAKLNRSVLDTAPTDAIRDLINGWYQGTPGGSRTNFHKEYVPTAWNSETNLYRNMFKVTCRMCHTSRQNAGTYFDSSAMFLLYSPTAQVCENLVMPNAQRAFGILWGSLSADKINHGLVIPNQVAVFTNALGFGGPCPKP